MIRIKYFLFISMILGSGCATLQSGLPEQTAYSDWPSSFQADYLWESATPGLSMAIQPKWIRVYVRTNDAVRCLAFNFLGATLWDVTLQQTDRNKIRIRYQKGKGHPLARWMTKMLGQIFFHQPPWQGWCWSVSDIEHEKGLLKKLVFKQQNSQRQLKLHQGHPGELHDTIFEQQLKSSQE